MQFILQTDEKAIHGEKTIFLKLQGVDNDIMVPPCAVALVSSLTSAAQVAALRHTMNINTMKSL